MVYLTKTTRHGVNALTRCSRNAREGSIPSWEFYGGKMQTEKITVDWRSTTVGELIKFLQTVPLDTPIETYNVGESGILDGIEFEKNTYDNGETDICINVKAESAYVY